MRKPREKGATMRRKVTVFIHMEVGSFKRNSDSESWGRVPHRCRLRECGCDMEGHKCTLLFSPGFPRRGPEKFGSGRRANEINQGSFFFLISTSYKNQNSFSQRCVMHAVACQCSRSHQVLRRAALEPGTCVGTGSTCSWARLVIRYCFSLLAFSTSFFSFP